MAVELLWLDEAKDDLRSILEFISRDKPMAASAYVAAISNECTRLVDFPALGRVYDGTYRMLVVGSHVVLYRYDESGASITIAAVVHGSRDIGRFVANLAH